MVVDASDCRPFATIVAEFFLLIDDVNEAGVRYDLGGEGVPGVSRTNSELVNSFERDSHLSARDEIISGFSPKFDYQMSSPKLGKSKK